MSSHKTRLLLLCICFLLSGCSPRGEMRRVLVIHSYENPYSGYPEFNERIRKQFSKEKIHVDIRTLYLDCESYDENAEFVQMSYLLDSVSKDWTPEVILVNEDQATYSLLACGHPLSKKVPVVFSGVNYPNDALLARHPNVTGFRDHLDILANIGVAKDLFGEKISPFTILDFTYIDRQIRADIKQQEASYKVVGLTDSTMRWKKSKLEPIEKESSTQLLILGARTQQEDLSLMWALRKFFTNKQCYIQLKRDFTTINIGNICYNPSLTAINKAFGFGERLLGGYITTLPIQVEDQVGAAAHILRGATPTDIPVTDSRKEYVVDWNAMLHWKIPISSIPDKYNIINIPIREQHPMLWSAAIGIGTLSITLLIVWLFLLYRRELRRRRQALYALADEKQTLALAIEGSNTYAWKFEADLFLFEKAFWISQGATPRELTFTETLDFIHPEHRKSVLKEWGKNEFPERRITQMRCNFNGLGYSWWEFRYSTVFLDNGDYKTAGLLLNIQQAKDREQELEEARKLAEKAELKESFLANMSHEIRTPLNAIVGFSNIITSDEELDPEDKQTYIEAINQNNELLLKLINDILELSRIESGSMSFEFTDCLVSELIDNIYMTHQLLIPTHLQFIKEPDDVPMLIHVDTMRLTQVITNFLNNAGKFTQSGHIKLGSQYLSDTKQVCFYVEDTGLGIPAAEQKMIFSRFYKRDEFAQGTGLGLSICQVIIEKLDGEIDLWSEPGKGSRFMIMLPCKVLEQKYE